MTSAGSEQTRFNDRLALSAIVLRLLIVLSPLTAVGVTWLAANRALPPVAAVVLLISIVCAVSPSSHFGILVVATVAIQWVAIVPDRATPWSIVAAAALTVFHASHAAATVAPATTAWTSAMRHRWMRRTLALIVASAAMWLVVAAADATELASNTLLLTASLVVLAAGALWAGSGNPGHRRTE